MPRGIQHVFVLILENRSFDHMLGFSGITGTDAVSGRPTSINGLTSAEISLLQFARSFQTSTLSGIVLRKGWKWPPPPSISIRQLLASNISNIFNGQSYSVTPGAHYAMPVDPGHEFPDAVEQLCGLGVEYQSGGAYPPIINSGFVASYVAACAAKGIKSDPGEIMRCYGPSSVQLPVLNALAQEFVVCDNWHASIPGPTWPNRFFAHAASSGGLDHSPDTDEILKWETADGFTFKNGTIFDLMNGNNVKWRIYAGDAFPGVLGLKRINPTDIHEYSEFAQDVAQPDYPISYTFIEPSYGHTLTDFLCGTSQHPLDDVTRGESLIKCTYDAVRNSAIWNNSLLIITWDEHGGFYDHVPPPRESAVAPGDTSLDDENNQYGFTFRQYGVRVPAVVISPLIPRNLIDHRVYDHSSIPATVEACFGLNPLTQRDAGANNLTPLVSLSNPRSDALPTLPSPAVSGIGGCDLVSCSAAPAMEPLPPSRPNDSINEGNIPGVLHSALRWDLALTPPEQRDAIFAQFRALRTRSDAWQYRNQVQQKVRAAKAVALPKT